MALSPDQKFSTFTDGGDLEVGDIIVGLKNGVNTRFTFPSTLPVGIIVPVSQGGTGATTAAGARTNLGLGTIATQDADNVSITGGAISSVAVPTPTLGTEIANKDYVDGVASGISFYLPARLATTANFASTYDNGTDGVGATLTASSVGALSFDGEAVSSGELIFVRAQTNTFENGLYIVSVVGDGATEGVLTRSTLFDTPGKINFGDTFGVVEGDTLAGTFWQQDVSVADIGTDPITFVFPDITTLTSAQTVTGSKTFNAFSGTLDGDITLDGNFIPGSGGLQNVQIFTSSGTWNKPANFTNDSFIEVTVIGGGGGSGGTAATGASQATSSGCGGGGGFSQATIISSLLSASETVTIGAGGAAGAAGNNSGGAGGASSFGAFLTCTGGGGGAGSPATGTNAINNSGDGGVGSGGDININGGKGDFGYVAQLVPFRGHGGGTPLGQPGTLYSGYPAVLPGYGGGGAGNISGASAAAQGGQTGQPGIVIVREYY